MILKLDQGHALYFSGMYSEHNVYLVSFLRYSTSNNGVRLTSGHHSIDYTPLRVSMPLYV